MRRLAVIMNCAVMGAVQLSGKAAAIPVNPGEIVECDLEVLDLDHIRSGVPSFQSEASRRTAFVSAHTEV